jgi:hypothetical protein
MAINYDLTYVKGDTVRLSLYLTGSTGAPLNLTGCTLTAQLRKGYYPSTLVASYQQYVSTGLTATQPYGYTGGLSCSATGGTAYLVFGSTYTEQLSASSMAKYDLQLYDPSTKDITTLVRGNIEILPEVTYI